MRPDVRGLGLERTAGAAAVAVGLFVTASCTLVRPLDYLVGEGGSSADASDARLDQGPSGDGDGAATDAGADASFCALHTSSLLCVDFDEGSGSIAFAHGLRTGLKAPTTEPGGSTSLVSSVFSSPPASLTLATGAVPSGARARAFFDSPSISGPASHARLSFAVHLDDAVTSDTVDFVTLIFGAPNQGDPVRVFYALGSGSDRISLDGTSPAPSMNVPSLRQHDWVHVALDARFDGTRFTTRLFFEGNEAGELAGDAAFAAGANSYFFLGLDVAGPSDALQGSFDDVVFDVE
jgi:hypothetical protein